MVIKQHACVCVCVCVLWCCGVVSRVGQYREAEECGASDRNKAVGLWSGLWNEGCGENGAHLHACMPPCMIRDLW